MPIFILKIENALDLIKKFDIEEFELFLEKLGEIALNFGFDLNLKKRGD